MAYARPWVALSAGRSGRRRGRPPGGPGRKAAQHPRAGRHEDRPVHGALGDGSDATPGWASGRTSRGSSVTACPWATSARLVTLSLVRWRMSGSNPPSSRHVRFVISSHPVSRWPVVQASPASSASGTASRCGAPPGGPRAARGAPGRGTGPRGRRRRVAVRLVLPLVGQDEIDVPERERGQRLLRLGLDELAAEVGCISCECLHRRYARGGARPTGTRRSVPSRRPCPRPRPARPPPARPARAARRRDRPARARRR